MPLFPMGIIPTTPKMEANPASSAMPTSPATQIKNRRKRYLDMHPEYFSADLELAGPLVAHICFTLMT